METFKKLFVVFLMVAFTAGCATKSDNIKADYVSPLAYQSYNCDQVGQEMLRVGRRVSEIAAQQDSTSTKDKVAMGVGLVVFWPSLFFLAAGEDHKKEIARLKGESDALEQIAIMNHCTGAIAQRDAAVEAWKKEHQDKNETDDALLEAKYEECVSDFKKSECDRKIIADNMKKEKEKNAAANVTKESALPSTDSLLQNVATVPLASPELATPELASPEPDFPIVAYDFDAKSGKGTLVVDIRGEGMNARHRVVDNIGKICSDKNVTLISGEETREGGRYRVLNESVRDGLLTISFEASW